LTDSTAIGFEGFGSRKVVALTPAITMRTMPRRRIISSMCAVSGISWSSGAPSKVSAGAPSPTCGPPSGTVGASLSVAAAVSRLRAPSASPVPAVIIRA